MSVSGVHIQPAMACARPTAAEPDGGHLQALMRGIELLRAFDVSSNRMTIAEAARAAKLTRAGARRILLTLEQVGYVRCDGRHYYLTARVLELGRGLPAQPVWEVTRRVLASVARTVNETVSAGVLDGHEVIYTVRVRSSRVLHLDLRESARLPAFASSIGRVLLAALPPAALDQYFRHATLTKFTKFTEIDPAALRRRLNEVRRRGWCYVREEVEKGVSGVAVPLIDPADRTVGALTMGTSPERTSLRTVKTTMVPLLREAAATIRRELQSG